jgi:hypothetical protein
MKMTISSECSKTIRKKFLQRDRIGIIPVGGYTDNRKQKRKAFALLMLEENRKGRG